MDQIEPKLLKRLQNWLTRLCKITNSDVVPRSFISCFDYLLHATNPQLEIMEGEARELMNDWIEVHASYTADAARVAEHSSDGSSSLPVSGESESGYCCSIVSSSLIMNMFLDSRFSYICRS